ncbi:MAG: hypothetical protein HY868_11690 [Chloroflexi bacterium]|nr:hypothetical protein [Chloroflexota bacterium]
MKTKYLFTKSLAIASVLLLATVAIASAECLANIYQATARFNGLETTLAEGYATTAECISNPREGAIGIQYSNSNLLSDGVVDARHPESLFYEPQDNGTLRLVGVEYRVYAGAENGNRLTPPVLFGREFQSRGDYYTLRVWAWRDNPNGLFADWNSQVSCY